jgi:hypothetical protein
VPSGWFSGSWNDPSRGVCQFKDDMAETPSVAGKDEFLALGMLDTETDRRDA